MVQYVVQVDKVSNPTPIETPRCLVDGVTVKLTDLNGTSIKSLLNYVVRKIIKDLV